MGLRSLACWNCGFESRRGHGCLSLVNVVCCQVEVSASGWSLVQRSATDCCVSECQQESTIMKRPWPTGGCCAIVIKNQEPEISISCSQQLTSDPYSKQDKYGSHRYIRSLWKHILITTSDLWLTVASSALCSKPNKQNNVKRKQMWTKMMRTWIVFAALLLSHLQTLWDKLVISWRHGTLAERWVCLKLWRCYSLW